MNREAGKGSKRRPTDETAYGNNWDRIYGKKTKDDTYIELAAKKVGLNIGVNDSGKYYWYVYDDTEHQSSSYGDFGDCLSDGLSVAFRWYSTELTENDRTPNLYTFAYKQSGFDEAHHPNVDMQCTFYMINNKCVKIKFNNGAELKEKDFEYYE